MNHTEDQLKEARECIAEGMSVALALWFVPIPVAGSVACNEAEKAMVKGICKALGEPPRVDEFYWYFRKKYFLVNIVTYLPYVGATVQLLEVYALGQFVLTCVDEGIDIMDTGKVDEAWSHLEPKLWRASQVIAFYEDAAGKPFPSEIRGPFSAAVRQIAEAVQGVNRIPGLRSVQEAAGEGYRRGIGIAADVAKGTMNGLSRGMKRLFR